MDENSCEGETSKSTGNVVDEQEVKKAGRASGSENVGIKFSFGGKESRNQVSSRCGSSLDASGPSNDFSHFKSEADTLEIIVETRQSPPEENDRVSPEASAPMKESLEDREDEPTPNATTTEGTPQVEQTSIANILPHYDERRDYQPRVRMAPDVEEQLESRRPSVGPPPSYSFVMKQKKRLKPVPSLDPLVTDRPPPPTYSTTRGLFESMEESRLERICNLPSFAEPIWRSHSQPALCPRCGIIVLTTTHSHDSVATHVAALALCLFGCWPCCLLPYCMNVCKNTYHHCPICQTFLGLYTPW